MTYQVLVTGDHAVDGVVIIDPATGQPAESSASVGAATDAQSITNTTQINASLTQVAADIQALQTAIAGLLAGAGQIQVTNLPDYATNSVANSNANSLNEAIGQLAYYGQAIDAAIQSLTSQNQNNFSNVVQSLGQLNNATQTVSNALSTTLSVNVQSAVLATGAATDAQAVANTTAIESAIASVQAAVETVNGSIGSLLKNGGSVSVSNLAGYATDAAASTNAASISSAVNAAATTAHIDSAALLAAVGSPVQAGEVVPVSAESLPLPTGAATDAQSVSNTASINSGISSIVGAVNAVDSNVQAVTTAVSNASTQNHTDLTSVSSALSSIDSDIKTNTAGVTAFAAANHADVTAATSAISNASALNHADLAAIKAAIGSPLQVGATVPVLIDSADSANISAAAANTAATTAAIGAASTQAHSDSSSIASAVGQVDTDLKAFASANHTDLSATNTALTITNTTLALIDADVRSGNTAAASAATTAHSDAEAIQSAIAALPQAGATQTVAGAVSVSNFPTNQPVTIDSASSGYLQTIAQAQGASATDVAQMSGGSGVLGWLSGIYKALTGTLTASVSNFPATQAVSGSVTANAGTNLNTSALALESGGNLASINTKIPAQGQALAAGSLPVVLPTAQITALTPTSTTAAGTTATLALPVQGVTNGVPMSISGTVTANLGTTDTANLATVASAQGSNGTGITQPTGGSGLLGWLSGIYKTLTGTLTTSVSNFPATQAVSGSVTATNGGVFAVQNTAAVVGGNTLAVKTDSSGVTQPISASALPLPTGASTSALQTTANASLSSIAAAAGAAIMQSTGGTVGLVNGSATIGSVKVTDGTNTVAVTGPSAAATAAQPAQVVALSPSTPLPAGTNLLGKAGIDQTTYGTSNAVSVGGSSNTQVTPTVTASSAYTTGMVVGGVQTFANPFQAGALSGAVMSMRVGIKSTQASITGLAIAWFKSVPTGTFTDKTAPAIATADVANLITIQALTASPVSLGSNLTWYESNGLGIDVVGATNNLYAVLIVTGTPTFLTNSDVVMTLGVMKD